MGGAPERPCKVPNPKMVIWKAWSTGLNRALPNRGALPGPSAGSATAAATVLGRRAQPLRRHAGRRPVRQAEVGAQITSSACFAFRRQGRPALQAAGLGAPAGGPGHTLVYNYEPGLLTSTKVRLPNQR